MARYILDIPDKTIAHIRSDYGHGVKWINEEDRKILVELIYNAKPIGEVAPIIRGKWIEIQNGELAGLWKCSNCEEIALFQVEYWSCKQKQTPFCPFCGAKMEESGDNQ